MSGGSTRISLGLFAIFFGMGLFIILRGDSNDAYSGVLVCCIALMQLLDYGIWRNLDCYPGGPNDRATRGLYTLLWFLPSILCFTAAYFANNVIFDPSSRMLLWAVGAIYFLIALIFTSMIFERKDTMCSTPGILWQPVYGFLHSEFVPMKPNILLLVGLIIPTLIVDPYLFGSGTIVISTVAYALARNFDQGFNGEWLSVNTLLNNAIGIWALLVPALRRDFMGRIEKY